MKQVVSLRGIAPLNGAHLNLNRMEAQHQKLDARIKELGRRSFLTPREQLEAAELKKQKLYTKDKIAQLRGAG